MPRKNLALAVLAFAALLPLTAGAQDAAAPTGVKREMLHMISDAETKLVELAEATPEAKFTWKPSKDVRTTAQVFMHVAAANFGIPGFAGVAPPQGFDFQTYETSLTKKADIHKALKDSFVHMKQGLAAMSDADMEKPVQLFGMETTARGAYMLLLSHAHEHLGQSIAYARSNGIVPPWTAREQQAAQKAKEKKTTAENK